MHDFEYLTSPPFFKRNMLCVCEATCFCLCKDVFPFVFHSTREKKAIITLFFFCKPLSIGTGKSQCWCLLDVSHKWLKPEL